jgi:hypothetical protein
MKKILFHVAVILTAIIVIIFIGLRQSTINFEDLPTYPHDYMPRLQGVNEYYAEVIADKDIAVEYRLGHFPIPEEAIPILAIEEGKEENKPLPLSPASSSYLLPKVITIEERLEGREELTLGLAIISKGDTPAVYAVKVNDIAIAYVSDPFPNGNNNIVLYTHIDIIKDSMLKDNVITIKVERLKVL